ncbi:hypothetical protein ACFVIM_19570 [Streptomyces sp. NPDC057638]|uniref:hypothetical protein n=1 Tax=Streptomyces sp. NPDC057638 TaxID=3346190 RepID=UPI00368B92EB
MRVVGYACRVVGIGPVYRSGQIVPCVVAMLRTQDTECALRWLYCQMDHVADRLDPVPAPCMRLASAPVMDGAARIRAWRADPVKRRYLWGRLADGRSVSVIFPDGVDHYLFSINPEWAPARARLFLDHALTEPKDPCV